MRLLIPSILLLLAGCAAQQAENRVCPDQNVTFQFDTPTIEGQFQFQKDLCAAIARVRDWWGPTYTGPIRVRVLDSRGPSMALVPAWRGSRGEMIFRSFTVRRGSSVTVHEMIHVFAPNSNRFLAEGLAVYANDHLKGPPGYPNGGKDLHGAARDLLANADLRALDGFATPTRLRLSNRLPGRQAYIVAGSFVRFLIETHGLEKFRKLYAQTPLVSRERYAGSADRWRFVYGKDLTALEADWRKVVLGG